MGIRRTSNHMIKNKYLSILMIIGLALTACSSDDNVVEQKTLEPGKTYYLTVDATKGSDATTRALTLSGSTLNASWATSEHVYVQISLTNPQKYWFNGSIQPQSAGATTQLSGALSVPTGWKYQTIEGAKQDGVFALPLELYLQFPRTGNLDYTGQVGTIDDIAAKYDYATATAHVTELDDNHITASSSVTFENQQAIVKFTLTDKADGTTKLSPTALTVDYGLGSISLTDIPAATYTTNGNGVLYVAIPGFSGQNVTLTATCSSGTYTYTSSSAKTFINGKYYEISVKMTKQ